MLATLNLTAICLYAVGLHRLWPGRARSLPKWVVAFTWLAHAGVVAWAWLDPQTSLGLVNIANTVSLVMVGIVALSSVRLPIASLYVLLFPISILTLTSSLLVTPGNSGVATQSSLLILHILISLTAYSALMMAACQSILLAVLEKRLKEGRAVTWLPALETMEQLLINMLWIGLALLTISIASGFVFLDDLFEQRVVHHTVITSASWLVYLAFLVGRYFFGWRGLTAVRWTLVAFTLLVVGYLGSKFVLEFVIQP